MISRRLLLLGGTALAGSGVGVMWLRDGGEAVSHAQCEHLGGLRLNSGLGREFDHLLASLAGTDPLGAAWIAAEGNQRPEPLAMALSESLSQEPADLSVSIAARVREDFRQGLTCQVDGWLLSRTECRLAGLRHILVHREPENAQLIAAETEVRAVADYPQGEIAPLAKWGPKSTRVGEKFNVQLDGHSGFWFQFSGAPAHARIAIDGELVKTSVSAKVVTSGLFGEMQERILATPGRYDIALVDPVRGIQQPVGQFLVRPRKPAIAADDTGFCEIERWGPQSTRAGVARNEQPDGSMGIWVISQCMPADTQLMVGDDIVRSGVRKRGLTGSIPLVLLEIPGEIELFLYSAERQQKFRVGVLTVTD